MLRAKEVFVSVLRLELRVFFVCLLLFCCCLVFHFRFFCLFVLLLLVLLILFFVCLSVCLLLLLLSLLLLLLTTWLYMRGRWHERTKLSVESWTSISCSVGMLASDGSLAQAVMGNLASGDTHLVKMQSTSWVIRDGCYGVKRKRLGHIICKKNMEPQNHVQPFADLTAVSLTSAWRVLAMLPPSSSSLVFQDYSQTSSLVFIYMNSVVLFGASLHFWTRDTVRAVLYPCFLAYRQHVLRVAGLSHTGSRLSKMKPTEIRSF